MWTHLSQRCAQSRLEDSAQQRLIDTTQFYNHTVAEPSLSFTVRSSLQHLQSSLLARREVEAEMSNYFANSNGFVHFSVNIVINYVEISFFNLKSVILLF